MMTMYASTNDMTYLRYNNLTLALSTLPTILYPYLYLPLLPLAIPQHPAKRNETRKPPGGGGM